jgi:hypothetical protein
MADYDALLPGFVPRELPRDPSLGIPFPLEGECGQSRLGVSCTSLDGVVRPNPYGPNDELHYTRECARCGSHIDHVSATRVALKLGINLKSKTKAQTAAELFEPSPQVAVSVVLRDNRTCVYLGCEHGKSFADGTVIRCTADHIIPRIRLLDKGVETQRELYEFARNRQLVTACQKHNSGKGAMLAPYDQLERLFCDVVQRGADNRLDLYLLRRLYQCALNPPRDAGEIGGQS